MLDTIKSVVVIYQNTFFKANTDSDILEKRKTDILISADVVSNI